MIAIATGCDLEGTDSFSCGSVVSQDLLDNPPVDTAFVNINAPNSELDRSFRGIKSDSPGLGDPFVDGLFENLFTYERQPDPTGGLMVGLGTEILDVTDSAFVILSFDMRILNGVDEVCRPVRTLQFEHDWSTWVDNLPGANLLIAVPINGEMITFTSDTDQPDGGNLKIEGVEILDGRGYYSRIKGTFNGNVVERDSLEESPNTIRVSGSFVLNMQLAK